MASFSLTQIPFSDPDLLRPGAGANYWQSTRALTTLNSLDDYWRVDWVDLQTAHGTINWTALDNKINAAIDAGRKITVGIPTCDDFSSTSLGGVKIAYPTFVHTLMQAESVKDWIFTGTNQWVPNWNSNSYLTELENFLVQMNTHLLAGTHGGKNYRDAILYIDIRGFGNYGEWHNFGSGYNGSSYLGPAGTAATSATLIRILNAHKTAFPTFQLLGNIDMVYGDEIPNDVGYAALNLTTNIGPIGFRSDHLADAGTFNFENIKLQGRSVNGLNFQTAYVNVWKRAPITGEIIQPGSGSNNGGASCNLYHLLTEVNTYHYSMFSNVNVQNTGTACEVTNITTSAKTAGHRFTISSGSVTDNIVAGASFGVTLNWQNLGASTTYETWTTVIELRKVSDSSLVTSWTSSFIPRLFLPTTPTPGTLGTPVPVTDTFTMPSNVPNGSYKLDVVLKDPAGYRAPLPLAITGRQGDGSYPLGNITVGTAASPLPVINAFTAGIYNSTSNILSFTVTNAAQVVVQYSFDNSSFVTLTTYQSTDPTNSKKYFQSGVAYSFTASTTATIYYRIVADGVVSNVIRVFRSNSTPTQASFSVQLSGTNVIITATAAASVRVRIIPSGSNTALYDKVTALTYGQNIIPITNLPRGYTYVYVNNRRFLIHR